METKDYVASKVFYSLLIMYILITRVLEYANTIGKCYVRYNGISFHALLFHLRLECPVRVQTRCNAGEVAALNDVTMRSTPPPNLVAPRCVDSRCPENEL